MALPDLTGKNIQETYQRLIQYDADTGDFYNGTGSLVNGLIQSIADASSGRQSDGNTLNSVSSSVVTLLEFSSSLDATFATDAELTSLSSSFVVTTDSLQTQVSRNVTDIAALDTSVDVLTSATSSYLTSVPSTYFNSSLLITENISKNFNYTSSLNVAEITSSVEGAIIDYRLTSLNSGSRVGTFYYAHDGTTLSYNDLTVPGAGIGGDPTLSATLDTGSSIVSIDIENAAGFNFSGFAKKFNKLDNAIPVADPNISYLLNVYPSENVVGAYSIRQLDQLYTGSALRVRRASDNSELDIEYDVNGYLDTLAITSHCGNNIGYVTIWYDQSGNNNHLTQSIAGNQPKIYDGTSIYEANGQPCIRTRDAASSPVLGGVIGIDYTGGISVYNVANAAGYGQNSVFLNPLSNGWDFRHGHAGVNPGFRVGNKTAQIPNPRNDIYQILQSGFYDSSTSTIYAFLKQQYEGNSSPIQTGSATGVSLSNTINSELQITTRAEYQELIIINDYEISNREGIFTNINNYYSIYDTGLLEDYSGAAAAYSVRQLSTSATSSMNIRRASDNTEQVIGFTANGDLDTGSIETFCAGTECYVDTWYDQSGNENNAEQTNASFQPLIYSASAVITENSKPALEFTPIQQYSIGDYDTFNFIHQGDESCISVVTTYKSGKRITWGSSYGNFQVGFGFGVDDRSGGKRESSYIINQDNQAPSGVSRGDWPYMDSQSHHLVYLSGSHATAASRYISSVNGSPGPASGINTSTITPATGSADALFRIPYHNQNPGNAIVQELIVWNSTPLSSSINSNINSYFNIY